MAFRLSTLLSAAQSAAESSPSSLLSRNIPLKEILPLRWLLESPNYLRIPLWKQYWEAQFANRSFFFFGNAWTAPVSFAFFLWASRIFDPPPKERLDKYWFNSPKFRILSAFHNPGKRPAVKISLMTYEVRYFNRGLDHPFSLNEIKDFWYKIKENYLIEKHPGVQFPYVFRQFNNVKTPGVLKVQQNCFPSIFRWID
ncbi:hypothetical protein IE077_002582 [Cardiosporidium cionae]|uniref:Uncharacterized protein n=1 Tax=Cardiosporidium cionae TaxID=476202 RepID=A0ABQ7JAL0_9APIC|nr:hypothetical protein IE077_002582 [Cardiosporidium cionae]|eukprot:KAF8820995.1 hypothetical protein IE077_002582 [Cardiosporidium cionae]